MCVSLNSLTHLADQSIQYYKENEPGIFRLSVQLEMEKEKSIVCHNSSPFANFIN